MNNSTEKAYLKQINFKKVLNNFIQEIGTQKVLIYGAGLLFKTAVENYDFSKLNIVGISDKKFEEENAPEQFIGFKTYKPDLIEELNPDYILITIKEYNNLLRAFLIKYPNIKVLPLFPKPKLSTFVRRNITHNCARS